MFFLKAIKFLLDKPSSFIIHRAV